MVSPAWEGLDNSVRKNRRRQSDTPWEDRLGMGPPRARTEVVSVDLGYWAVSQTSCGRRCSRTPCEDRVFTGPASEKKSSKGRN